MEKTIDTEKSKEIQRQKSDIEKCNYSVEIREMKHVRSPLESQISPYISLSMLYMWRENKTNIKQFFTFPVNSDSFLLSNKKQSQWID